VRQTGQLIRRARNTIEVRIGQRPPAGDDDDVLYPEIGQRAAALGEPRHRFILLERRGHGALDLLGRPANAGAVTHE
jgi:hypothetical protein